MLYVCSQEIQENILYLVGECNRNFIVYPGCKEKKIISFHSEFISFLKNVTTELNIYQTTPDLCWKNLIKKEWQTTW